jgi:hypothetical protein
MRINRRTCRCCSQQLRARNLAASSFTSSAGPFLDYTMFATVLACKRFECFPAIWTEKRYYDENGDETDRPYDSSFDVNDNMHIYTWRGYTNIYCARWKSTCTPSTFGAGRKSFCTPWENEHEECLCGRIHSFNELQAIGWRDFYDPYDQTDRYENWWDEYQEQIDDQLWKEEDRLASGEMDARGY